MSAGSASFTNRPAAPGTASVKRAAPLTGFSIGQALGLRDLAVDLAERGREVHDAAAVVGGDEVGRPRPASRRRSARRASRTAARSAGRRAPRRRRTRRPRRRRRAPPSTRARAITRSRPPGSGDRTRTYSMSGPTAAPTLETSVHGVVVHTSRSKSRSTHREADVDGVLGDVAVRAGLAELVARERGAAAAAVGDDLGALVELLRVPHLAEQPPDALDVTRCSSSSRRRTCRATCRCGPSAPTSPRRSAAPTRDSAG